MKRTLIGGLVVFAAALLAPQIGTAQGTTTFLSNLGQTSTGSDPVGSDSWLAATFYTGNNASGYFINSVQLAMGDASGTPSGFTVMIYAQSSFSGAVFPGSSLGTLTGPADPETSGTYTYIAPSDLTLSPGTPYFIILTSGTAVANGAFEWSYAGANNYNPNASWIAGPFAQSGNGSTWHFATGEYLQFALSATAAPEPGVIGLFALGGLLVGFQRRKARPV
jgi:hypothetical protein